MSEDQKYRKKKNILLILFMFLLVVFIVIICGILIYAKLNPKPTYLSPDDIEIKEMMVFDYPVSDNYSYVSVTALEDFIVKDNDEDIILSINNDKVIRTDNNEEIKIMQNDEDINNNIKFIYQTDDVSLVLTNDGRLYRFADNIILDNVLKVGQILSGISVDSIVNFTFNTDYIYVLTSEQKLINIENQKEFSGIVSEIETSSGTIYVYENKMFGLEEGKVFTDESGNGLRIKISFDNKIICENDVIYEIDNSTNSLFTSNLGNFSKIWYKTREDNSYDITLLSSTGYKDFYSSYYYSY